MSGYQDYVESLLKKQKQTQQDEGASAQDPSTTCEEAQPAQDESAPVPPATRDEAQPAEGKSAQVPPATRDEDSDEDVPFDTIIKKNAAKALQKEKEEASEREKKRLLGLKLASKDRETASKDVYGSNRPVGKNPLTQEEIKKALRKARDDARPEYDRVVLGIGAKVQVPTKKEKYPSKWRVRSNGMPNKTNWKDIGLLKKNVPMTTESMALCPIRRG